MDSSKLKSKLKSARSKLNEAQAVRLHRAISWFQCSEKSKENIDLQYISLWISFNACYAINVHKAELLSEKENFREFVRKLVSHDNEKRFYKLLWEQFSGPGRLLIGNQYVFKPFWDFHRGELKEWKPQFDSSLANSMKFLSEGRVPELLEVVLDRLYTLRNQLIHGGATFESEVNRNQVKDGNNMLKLLVPLIIEIMVEANDENWGDIYYPVIG